MSAEKSLGRVAKDAFHKHREGWSGALTDMSDAGWGHVAQAVIDEFAVIFDEEGPHDAAADKITDRIVTGLRVELKAEGAAEERERVSKLLARWEEFGIDAPNGMSAVEWLRDGGKPVAECCNCGPRSPALPGTDMCNECFEDDRFNQ